MTSLGAASALVFQADKGGRTAALALTAAALISVLYSLTTVVHAGGFEKATMWSGKYSGIGGAASAVVTGSESLLFNPAGLAAGEGLQISVNGSPTLSQFEGPVAVEGQSETSTWGFSPVYGLTASYKLSEKLGIGVGSFIVGGAGNQFNDLDFSQLNFTGASNLNSLTPDIGAKLLVNEVAFGVGYQLTNNWRLGASYRATIVAGHLQAAVVTPIDSSDPTDVVPGSLANVLIDGLSAVNTSGFRLGLQYMNDSKDFGFGVNYRSAVGFTAQGTTSGNVELASTLFRTYSAIGGGDAEVTNSLPQALGVGFMLGFGNLRILPEYTWTNYSANQKLDLSGTITVFPDTSREAVKELSDVTQNWMDQHNIRLGAEYDLSDALVLRGAYVGTTAVVPGENARATFSSPGWGHSLYLGAGYQLSNSMTVNATGEASLASGEGTSENGVEGTFSSQAYTLHLGVDFRF